MVSFLKKLIVIGAVGFLAYHSLWWVKGLWRTHVNPAFPITTPQINTRDALDNDVTNHEADFLQRMQAVVAKQARGEKLTAQDREFLKSGIVELTKLEQQNVQLLKDGYAGRGTPPTLVCPLNPEACPSCKDAIPLRFEPNENEKILKSRKACWQVVVIPETRRHIETQSTKAPWLWLSGQPRPIKDEPGAHIKFTANLTSIRFMASEEDGAKTWIKIGKTAKDVEGTPSKLALK